MKGIADILTALETSGNMRRISADDAPSGVIDLSSNDYLGLARNRTLADNFVSTLRPEDFMFGSSASRLLAARQHDYTELETAIAEAYGRPALLFNSGYHANTGIVGALGSKRTLFVADKLVHASIIDGLNLAVAGGAEFVRFRHNDIGHLERILEKNRGRYERTVIVAESVYSMDGDRADLRALVEVKRSFEDVILYVDEAHAVGVLGPAGLGLSVGETVLDDVDILIGTFGKALASMGAYAVTSPAIKAYLTNRARSLVFSTALPAIVTRWSLTTFRYALTADDARRHLDEVAKTLASILEASEPSHIRPLIVGDPYRALAASARLAEAGYRVLAIRTPTVPPGTDRLRFSLSADITPADLEGLAAIDFRTTTTPFPARERSSYRS